MNKINIKIVFGALILIILGAFTYAILLSVRIETVNMELENANNDLEDANEKYALLEAKATKELEECLDDGTKGKWEVASQTNTLLSYSTFIEGCDKEIEDCHSDQIKTAIDKILNADGYVQFIETDGNELFTKVDLNLDGGEYVKFDTDKAVRNGAIGIDDCGASKPRKVGIVLKNKTVKVLEKCYAQGSESVWVHIQYAK